MTPRRSPHRRPNHRHNGFHRPSCRNRPKSAAAARACCCCCCCGQPPSFSRPLPWHLSFSPRVCSGDCLAITKFLVLLKMLLSHPAVREKRLVPPQFSTARPKAGVRGASCFFFFASFRTVLCRVKFHQYIIELLYSGIVEYVLDGTTHSSSL